MSSIKKIHVQMDRHVQMYMYMDMDILYHRMQRTSVAWVFTIAVGIILVLTILWNLDEIIFKIKLKSFPRKYKIEQGEYTEIKQNLYNLSNKTYTIYSDWASFSIFCLKFSKYSLPPNPPFCPTVGR